MPSRESADYPPAIILPKEAMYPITPYQKLRDVVVDNKVKEFRNRIRKDFDLK